jgi:hypothetical protein
LERLKYRHEEPSQEARLDETLWWVNEGPHHSPEAQFCPKSAFVNTRTQFHLTIYTLSHDNYGAEPLGQGPHSPQSLGDALFRSLGRKFVNPRLGVAVERERDRPMTHSPSAILLTLCL